MGSKIAMTTSKTGFIYAILINLNGKSMTLLHTSKLQNLEFDLLEKQFAQRLTIFTIRFILMYATHLVKQCATHGKYITFKCGTRLCLESGLATDQYKSNFMDIEILQNSSISFQLFLQGWTKISDPNFQDRFLLKNTTSSKTQLDLQCLIQELRKNQETSL